MKILRKIPPNIVVLILGIIIFIPFLGETHLFDWEELFYAEIAREMLLTNNFQDVQLNFQVLQDIPPFFSWMQALSMHFFGINEFAARLPNAIIGIITLLILLKIGTRLKDYKFGLLWVLVYVSSFLPHFYFKTGLIDPSFNLFIFLSIYFVSMLTENDEFYYRKNKKLRRIKLLAFAAFFTGIAVLTKGPIGLFFHILIYSVYFILNKFRKTNSIGELIWFGLIFIMTIFTWYGFGFYENGLQFLDEFLLIDLKSFSWKDIKYEGPFYNHFIILFLGGFPASFLMFGGIKKHDFSTDLLQNFQKWMTPMLIIVIVFSLLLSKMIIYSSLAYFPITFFATYYLYYYLKGKKKWKWYHNNLLLFLGIALGISISIIPLIGFNPEIVIGFLKNEFIIEKLKTDVYWSNWEAMYGVFFIFLLILSANLFYTKNKKLGTFVLLFSCILIIEIVIVLYLPRIEKYSQSATIEFYESKQNEDCYIEVLDFKSYAYLFYSKKDVEDCVFDKNELLRNKLTKPAYFISRIDHKDKFLKDFKVLDVLYEKNGYVFYVKKK